MPITVVVQYMVSAVLIYHEICDLAKRRGRLCFASIYGDQTCIFVAKIAKARREGETPLIPPILIPKSLLTYLM